MGRRRVRGHGRSSGHHEHPVVFSRTLKTAEWANNTIAAGDRGRDGHILVWCGVGLWRSLTRLDMVSGLQHRAQQRDRRACTTAGTAEESRGQPPTRTIHRSAGWSRF